MTRLGILSAVAILGLASTALAQPTPDEEPFAEPDGGPSVEPGGEPGAEPSAQTSAEEQASAAFERGQRAFEDDDYTGALTAFEEALRLAPSDVVRFNMALCLERLGRFRAALTEYETAAASPELGPETRADAERRAERVRTRIGTLVFPGPAGARVEIAGVEGCTAPCRIIVDPGTHEVRRTDGEGRVLSVAVNRGEEKTVELEPPVRTPPGGRTSPGRGLRLGLVGWIGGGVAIVGTITTIALGIRVGALKEDYDANPNRDDLEEGRATVVATNVALVFAILGAATVALDVFVLQRPAASPRETPGRLSLAF